MKTNYRNYPHAIIILIFIFLTVDSNSQSLPQEWLATFHGQGKNPDRIAKIKADSQGNVVVSGYAQNSNHSQDIFALKYNAQGDTLWEYYFDGTLSEEDFVTDMEVDASGNVYLTGSATGTSYLDQCVTIKLNSNGIMQWESLYNLPGNRESQPNGIAVDTSGNVYITGWYNAFNNSRDGITIKYNPLGQVEWVDLMSTTGNRYEEARDIVIDANQQAIICGFIYDTSTAGGLNVFVKKYTTSGLEDWMQTYTNPSFLGGDKGEVIRIASNGNIIVGGQSANGTITSTDVLALSYSPTGVQQWATIYSDSTTTFDEQFYSMALDPSGNVYIAGTDFLHQLVYRIDANGSMAWRKSWSSPVNNFNTIPFDIATDEVGGIYTVGKGIYPGPNHFGNGGLDNLNVVKYSAAGDSLWTYRLTSNTDVSIGFSIDVRDGKVYAGGFKADTAYVDENFFTSVLDTSGTIVNEWEFSGIGNTIMRGQFVRTDATNNVYCAGTIDRLYNNGLDVAIVKYDPAGNLLWEQYYTTPGWRNDTLTGMDLDQNGNLILSISSDTNATRTGYQPTLVKMSVAGNFLDTIWYNNVSTGVQFANSMLVRTDGSVVLCGTASISGGYLAYFDDQLNHQWTALIDSTPSAITKVNSVSSFPNGDIAVVGYSQTGPGTTGKLVAKRFDVSGNRLWSVEIDSAGVADEGKDIAVNGIGLVAVTGSSGAATVVAVIDGATGNLLWRTIYNPTASSTEYGVKVRYGPGNSITIISRGWSGFVARYFTASFHTITGSMLWSNSYDQTASDREPLELIVESTGRVVTAGWRIDGATTNYDYVLVGYTSAGVQEFENIYTTPNFNPDRLYSLTSDQAGDFIVTGESATEFLNNFLYEMVTIKFGGTVVDVNEIDLKSEVVVFPNPSAAGKYLLIDRSGFDSISGAKVFDSSGRTIKDISYVDLRGEIDLSNYTDGLYLLQYFRNEVPAGTIKLIKK